MMITKKFACGTGLALFALFAIACGEDATTTGGVRAINLKSGQTQTFDTTNEVPPGWAPCSDPTCAIPPAGPCQNLGAGVCETNPKCRLRQLGCGGVACAEPAPANGDAPVPPPCVPEPPKCDYECVPATTLACEELRDEKECLGNASCSWDALSCMLGCEQGKPCPPCPAAGICRTKAPTTCDSLGEKRCSSRPDCSWEPGPCALYDCPEGANCQPTQCPSFCREKRQPEPCPLPAMPSPDFCKGGHIVPRHNETGCLAGYDCVDDCAALPQIAIDCKPGQRAVPTFDPKGCITGFTCESECPAITLGMPDCHQGLIQPKHDPKTGCLTDYVCQECPAIPQLYPDCKDGTTARPQYNDQGCLTGYACEQCPSIDNFERPQPLCSAGQKPVKEIINGCEVGYRCA